MLVSYRYQIIVKNYNHDMLVLSDASIISISSHCIGLQSLNVSGCHHLTDASIILISSHCTGLQSLILTPSWMEPARMNTDIAACIQKLLAINGYLLI